MKQKLILIFLLGMIFYQPNAFGYKPVLNDETTTWNTIKGNLWGAGVDSIFTNIDTLINNKLYKKLTYYSIVNNSVYQLDLVGFIREDTIYGKLWYFSNYDTTERLVMDLSLEMGNMFWVGGVWNSYGGYHEVDSIWIDLFNRKNIRINILINPAIGGNNGEKLIMIEGVGTNIGIGYQDLEYIDNFPYLLCAWNNNIQIYQNNHPFFGGGCNLLFTNTNQNTSPGSIILFPNPTNNKLYIEVQEEVNIQLYNLVGIQIREYNNIKNTKYINVSDLKPGMYLIIIRDNNGNSFINRMVKK